MSEVYTTSLITYHSSLITYHLSLITYHSSLINYFLLINANVMLGVSAGSKMKPSMLLRSA